MARIVLFHSALGLRTAVLDFADALRGLGHVVVTPDFPEQEMDTRASTGIVYWAGAVDVAGSKNGLGYVELTNYDRYPYGETDETTVLEPFRGPFGGP